MTRIAKMLVFLLSFALAASAAPLLYMPTLDSLLNRTPGSIHANNNSEGKYENYVLTVLEDTPYHYGEQQFGMWSNWKLSSAAGFDVTTGWFSIYGGEYSNMSNGYWNAAYDRYYPAGGGSVQVTSGNGQNWWLEKAENINIFSPDYLTVYISRFLMDNRSDGGYNYACATVNIPGYYSDGCSNGSYNNESKFQSLVTEEMSMGQFLQDYYGYNGGQSPVPEPGTYATAGLVLVGLGIYRNRPKWLPRRTVSRPRLRSHK